MVSLGITRLKKKKKFAQVCVWGILSSQKHVTKIKFTYNICIKLNAFGSQHTWLSVLLPQGACPSNILRLLDAYVHSVVPPGYTITPLKGTIFSPNGANKTKEFLRQQFWKQSSITEGKQLFWKLMGCKSYLFLLLNDQCFWMRLFTQASSAILHRQLCSLCDPAANMCVAHTVNVQTYLFSFFYLHLWPTCLFFRD